MDEKQYFDSLEVKDGCILAVDDVDGTKTPLEIHAVGYSESSLGSTEIEIQQVSGGWWYSRKTFLPKDAKSYAEEITKAITNLSYSKLGL